MFASAGLFRGISCPKGLDCELLNCVFSHEADKDGISTAQEGQACHPASAGVAVSSQRKGVITPLLSGRRPVPVDTRDAARDKPTSSEKVFNPHGSLSQQPPLKKRRLDPNSSGKDYGAVSSPTKAADTPENKLKFGLSQNGENQTEKSLHLKAINSVRRPVSPPPSRASKQLSMPKKDPVQNGSSAVETLNPRMVSKAPESHKNRLTLLQMMHQLMEGLNQRVGEATKDDVAILSVQQLARLALDEEERMAGSEKEGLYRSTITGRITRLKVMDLDEWRKFVMEKYPDRPPPTQQTKVADSVPTTVGTGLSSIREEIEILRLLNTPLDGLEGHGYVTTPPTAKEIESSRKGVESAAGFEVCDRCGGRFQVFPGRDEYGRLTSHGTCQYHWAKLRRPMRQKTERTVGQEQSSFACCSQGLGSEGCTTAATHVFKVTDPKRLASILQFEKTPENSSVRANMPEAVAFDCEMAFTTLGMELIRVTAVSWPQNKKLLDVLVRTQGEILDLNTRFSGVNPDAYTSAPPWSTDLSQNGDDTSEHGEPGPEPLRKVESPAAARDLMFDLLTPTTPLIGHAIDNDLNSCRMIHPFVVDTVLLYPHPRGLPIRYGLKMLADKYLERGIQMGGAAGHDSKEDAIATGDLVKVKVKEKWQNLRNEGWTFEDRKLLAPGAAGI